jgi:hypothetical protein
LDKIFLSVIFYALNISMFSEQTKKRFLKPVGTYSGADVGRPEDAYETGTVASVRSFDFSRFNFNGDIYSNPPQYPTLSDVGLDGEIELNDLLDDLYERQDEVASALMKAFAEMLDLPTNTFLQHFEGGCDLGTIRLLHYPAAVDDVEASSREEANTIGISPHTDFEFFTLMHQRQPGLQFLVKDFSGDDAAPPRWVDAPVDVSFVVVAGDMLERFTNGVVKALPHRVLQTPHHRDSIIRFNALKAETLVAPLPQFVSPHRPASYTPVTMREHMETTMSNLRKGKGAWSPGSHVGDPGRSLTATFEYRGETSTV